MVQFDELRITPEGDKLIIKVSVLDLSYYKDVYLKAVYVDTEENFQTIGPSSTPAYTEILPTQDLKSIEIVLTLNLLNKASLNDNMFFVWVYTVGAPTPDVPCGKDNAITLGIAVNLYPIYQKAFAYIKELERCCEIPKGFIDMILLIKALLIAVRTGHYTKAIDYWEKFFKGTNKNVEIKTCGCYGRIS